MSCANCSCAVDETLEALNSVTSAGVNFAIDEGSVEYNPEEVSLGEVCDAIEDAGYETLSETRTIGITGTSRANCVNANQKLLESVPDVVDAEVNFAIDKVHVTYNPTDVNLDDMYRAVKDVGYMLVREDDDDDEDDVEDIHDAVRNREIRRQKHPTLFGATLLLLLLAMLTVELFGGGLPGVIPDTGVPTGWVDFVFATPVQVCLGREFYENSHTAFVRNHTANMDVLIVTGSSTAYLYSVAVLIGLLAGNLYFDTVALILVFITFRNYLEVRSRGQASEVLRTPLELEADTAALVDDDGTERETPLDEVEVDDRMEVRPGGKIPIDGVAVNGDSAIDESMVTGESVPVSRADGDEVVDPTVNQNGISMAESTKVGSEAVIQQIVPLVRKAQDHQPGIQNLMDHISVYFVSVVIANALLWGTVRFLSPETSADFIRSLPPWGLVAGGPVAAGGAVSTFEFVAAVFAPAVLIICPCTLDLATPTAMMVGTAIGAQNGALLKGGNMLGHIKDMKIVVLGKVGMLTKDEMTLADVVAVGPVADDSGVIAADNETLDEDAVLRYAASAERNSEHSLARTIIVDAAGRSLDPVEPDDFENVPGHRVRATVSGKPVLIGNHKPLSDVGVDSVPAEDAFRDLEGEGKTAMLIAVDGDLAGVVTDADEIKESAAEIVAVLRDRGATVHAITSNSERIVRAVAEQVGIDLDNVNTGVPFENEADAVESL